MEIPPNIKKILDLARWAPSGDNTQPWRFGIVDDSHFIIYGSDTRNWCVYDLDGRASQIAIGALIENIALAASELKLYASFRRRPNSQESQPVVDVELSEDAAIDRDPLVDFMRHRVTQRRPLSTRPLTYAQKRRLEASIAPDYSITWCETTVDRWQLAKLLSRNAKIRLTIREAYEVHRRIIEWDSQYSLDRIPDKAVGLDPVGLKLMRWAMTSWERVDFLNRYMAGTWLPRLQLDLLPGFFCGAHFVISAKQELENIDDYFNGGRAMQRFWLTATQQGLQVQPEMTPLIFARYHENRKKFTESEAAIEAAEKRAAQFYSLFHLSDANHGVFAGRIGFGNPPSARSARRTLADLSTPSK